ncbi:hypothetical protein WA026_007031 [Henosepilachna vigintioctopunctata]|uniref:Uncharacterized protein n=1 Tax=Henosepilachna vigintioctopunctata TaxID=420089 RepID=A0AAW1VBE6_9CUCU
MAEKGSFAKGARTFTARKDRVTLVRKDRQRLGEISKIEADGGVRVIEATEHGQVRATTASSNANVPSFAQPYKQKGTTRTD